MRNIILFILLFICSSLVSCDKQELKPTDIVSGIDTTTIIQNQASERSICLDFNMYIPDIHQGCENQVGITAVGNWVCPPTEGMYTRITFHLEEANWYYHPIQGYWQGTGVGHTTWYLFNTEDCDFEQFSHYFSYQLPLSSYTLKKRKYRVRCAILYYYNDTNEYAYGLQFLYSNVFSYCEEALPGGG